MLRPVVAAIFVLQWNRWTVADDPEVICRVIIFIWRLVREIVFEV